MAPDPVLGTSYRDVLRNREFRALLMADGLSTIGDQVARIAVALLVLERSGSAFAASATYACSYLTWLVGGPFLSAFADHFPRRSVMVVCDLLRMVLIASLAVPGAPLWVVFAVLVLVGLLAPPFEAAHSSLLADVLTGERYVVGNALMNATSQGAQLVGFLGGGVLVTALDVEGALLADAATFAMSAALLVSHVAERRHERPSALSGTSRRAEVLGGVSLLRRTPRLRLLLSWGLLIAGAVIAPEGLAVAIAAEDGRGALAAGVLTAAVPAGFLVGLWLVLRQPPDRRERLFPAMVTASCLPLLLTAFVQDVAVIAVLWVLAGVGSAMQLVANACFVQEVPPALRGRAFGVAVTLLMAVQGALLLVAGALAEVAGPRVPVAVLAGLALLMVPVLVSAAPSADRPAQLAEPT
ncbi:MAG: MFS transporter [Actinomycetota bacterium]|nr:MFS transporter [Actinomycetota bacterium]